MNDDSNDTREAVTLHPNHGINIVVGKWKEPVHIVARRWFDGQNTYHSVCVTFSDGTQRTAPFSYGYGDHCLHTAGELCGMADPYDMCRTSVRASIGVAVDVVDVERKRDLHNGGKRPKDGDK